MKLGILTCAWHRKDLTRLVLQHTAAVTPGDVHVVVTSPECREDLMDESITRHWLVLTHPNQPLGAKWNHGLEALRKTDVDAVMIIGTDDLVSAEVFEAARAAIESGKSSFGLLDYFSLHGASGVMKHCAPYAGERAGETIGTCRTWRRATLEAVGWKGWPDDAVRGLDFYSTLKVTDGHLMKDTGGAIVEVKAHPLTDMGSFWTATGTVVEPAGVLKLFPIGLALRGICNPVARATKLFDPEVVNPFISVCLMVRNERNGLPETLASLHGFADEVCVLDTGSDDDTVEIAEAYGCRVEKVQAELPFDFAKWRNESIDMGRGVWIVVMDGDEWLVHNQRNLMQLLKEAKPEVDAVVLNHSLIGGPKTAEGYSAIVRVLRGDKVRSRKIYYEYPVHHQTRGIEGFAVSDAFTMEPWFDATESAKRAIPVLEKILAQCGAPGLIGLDKKPLGGRKHEMAHAKLYLARSHAMLAGAEAEASRRLLAAAAAEGKEGVVDPHAHSRELHYEKAALYAGSLVDSDPSYLGAWLTLIGVVEQRMGLLAVEPLLIKAFMHHPRCKDLRWWRMRVDAAAIAVLGSQGDAYPLVPQRWPNYLPHLAEAGRFLQMRFGAEAEKA